MTGKIKNIINLKNEVWEVFEHKKKTAITLLFLMIFSSLLEVLSLGIILPIIEIIISDDFKNINFFNFDRYFDSSIHLTKVHALSIVLFIFLFFIISKNLIVHIRNKVHASLSFGLRGYWMEKLFKKYLYANYSFIIDNKQGTLINNVLVETEKAQICIKFIIHFLSALILFNFMLITLFLISWKTTLIMLLIALIFGFLTHNLIGAYSKKVGDEKLYYAKTVGNHVSEALIAIKEVKTLELEAKFLNSFHEIIKKYVKTLGLFRVNSQLTQIFSEIFVVLMLVIMVLYIIYYTNLDLKNLVPLVAVFVVIGNRMSAQISQIINCRMQILSNLVSLRCVFGLIKDDIAVENLNKGSSIDEINEDIVFKNVTFSYDKKNKIFTKLNFVMPKGKFIVLTGVSGSGKSTIIDLLLRLRSPDSGSIMVGNQNLSKFNIKSWRNKIGYVNQDIILFNKSIKDNILDGKQDASIEEIKSLCKKINAHDFIEKFPNKYETNVGDRGSKLSGGQNQRIVIARSMIKNPDLLIFDEATSALHQDLEAEIIDEIKSNYSNKTILFITHRLIVTKSADIIYELKDGLIEKKEFVR